MKTSLVSLAVTLFLLSGCATWQGQIAYPNTHFAALSKYEPAAIPKETQGTTSTAVGTNGVAIVPGKGAFIPVLGQVVLGSTSLNMRTIDRKFFDWQDPAKFITTTPIFTGGTWDASNQPTAVMSEGSANIDTSVGIKLTAGDKGIPVGAGRALTLKLGVDGTLKLNKVRVARVNFSNVDYITALADVVSNKDAYFVGEVLVCDVNSENLVGFALAYADPADAAINPTLKLDYDAKYSGVGLVLGASFNKVSVAGRVSFKELVKADKTTDFVPTLGASPEMVQKKAAEFTTALNASPLKLQNKVMELKTHLNSFGVGNPDIVLLSPFSKTLDANGHYIIMPKNPFHGGSEVFKADKIHMPDGKVTLSQLGEHQIQYSVVSGNTVYALRTTIELKQQDGKVIAEELIPERDVTYLKWEAMNPAASILP